MKRALSLLIGLLAYFGPPAWALFAIEADRKAQLASHGWLCGNPMIGIICLAGIASSVLSLVATGLGIASLRAVPEPRPRARVIELIILFLPFVIAGGYVTLLLFA
jgi:hypothetical protein